MISSSVFLEEAGELLIELESALLELENNPNDLELIQRVFRALHTIKGSGAMFGFDRVSHFTHDIEAVFDRVRENQLSVTPELINLTLESRDLIKALLNENDSATVDLKQLTRITDEFQKLSGIEKAPQPKSASAAPKGAPNAKSAWKIRFRPAHDVMRRGMNLLHLIKELADLGELRTSADVSYLPDLREMDPETCYLVWDFQLTTGEPLEAIRDVFIFVEDAVELVIERVGGPENQSEPPSGLGEPKVGTQAPEPAAKRDQNAAPRTEQRETRGGESKASIRVAAEKLDALLNFVGELVIVQARLSDLALRSNDAETVFIAEEVERLSAGLRDSAMSIRMLPLRGTFERFRRLIHDLTRDLKKEIDFTTEGAETELDKTVIDQLNDPLLHLIRNSADHGVEMPQERVAAGKAKAGKIHLSATYSGANVLIRISDDGRGLNPEAIRARAIQKGLIQPDARLGESDLVSLILMPGFSTAREVTDVSGRGVGMDVVRRNVEALRGSIEVTSVQNSGTTVTLRLPLTLAIIDGLLVRLAQAHFVIPLSSVVECIELSRQDVENMHGKRLVNVRGELVPYISLRNYFEIGGEVPAIEQVIIVETRDGRFGFALDEVLGDHQTVIKNLGRIYRDVQVISGATIMGDGSIALILDPHRLVQDVTASGSSIQK